MSRECFSVFFSLRYSAVSGFEASDTREHLGFVLDEIK
jgi:hypothetical protein